MNSKALLVHDNEVIDVDAIDATAMDKVYQWDAEMTQLLLNYIDVDNQLRLETLIKAYLNSLINQARFFTDYYTLLRRITVHIQAIDLLYRQITPQNEDNYLDLMEDILAIYCCLLTKHLIDISANQRQIKDTCRTCKNILVKCLLNKFDHIFNTLIKAEVDHTELINKIMFSNVSKHFLHIFKPTLDRRDVQMYARIYVLFQKWKEFQDKSKHHILDEALSVMYNRSSEWILQNKELKPVLMPMFECRLALYMHLLTPTQSICEQLFDYFKKRRIELKEETEDEVIVIDDTETEEDIAFRGLEDIPDGKFRKVAAKIVKLDGGSEDGLNDQNRINSTVFDCVRESQTYVGANCKPDVFLQYEGNGPMTLSQMVELYGHLLPVSSVTDDDLEASNGTDESNSPSTSKTLTTAESTIANEENHQPVVSSTADNEVEYVNTCQCTTSDKSSTLISSFEVTPEHQPTLAQDFSVEIAEQTEEQSSQQLILTPNDTITENDDNVAQVAQTCIIESKSRTEQEFRHIEEQRISCEVDMEQLTIQDVASYGNIQKNDRDNTSVVESRNLLAVDTNDINLLNNSEIVNELSRNVGEEEQCIEMEVPMEENHLEISIEDNPIDSFCESLNNDVVHQEKEEGTEKSNVDDNLVETSVTNKSEENLPNYLEEEKEFQDAFNGPLAKPNTHVHFSPQDNFDLYDSDSHSSSPGDDSSPAYEPIGQYDSDFRNHYTKTSTLIPEHMLHSPKSEMINSTVNSVCNSKTKVKLDQQLSKPSSCSPAPIHSILKNSSHYTNTPILNLHSFNKWLVHPTDQKLNTNCQVVINELPDIEIQKWKKITEMIRRRKSQKPQQNAIEILDFRKPKHTTHRSATASTTTYSTYDNDKGNKEIQVKRSSKRKLNGSLPKTSTSAVTGNKSTSRALSPEDTSTRTRKKMKLDNCN